MRTKWKPPTGGESGRRRSWAFGGAYQMQSQCGVSAAQSNKDLNLERYFLWLEGRAPADYLPLNLAREQYALFQETGAAQYRHQAWAHVQAALEEARLGRRGKAVQP
jgi:hypothetical protein